MPTITYDDKQQSNKNDLTTNIEAFIQPSKSSFVKKDASLIYDYSQGITEDAYYELSQCGSFDFSIYSQSPAEIINVYEKLILNSKWDVRESGDYQTIILGRNHMFYSIPRTIKIEVSKGQKKFKQIQPISDFSLSFFNKVNNININELSDTTLYDTGTIYNYKKEENKIDEEKEYDTNLENLINRNNCRKYSERHFAISGFNLVTHSINVNTEVPNTVTSYVEKLLKDRRNSVSIIPDVDEKYVKEIMIEPIIEKVSLEDSSKNKARNTEFMANKLLEEVKYVYQGSIIIKFNADIEIGDTIALIDNVNSVFGIFEIDSYEHVLDQRGLLTNLIVKASWEIKDPLLDAHSKEIGYKLLNNFYKDQNGKKDEKMSYITSLYMKYLVQAPKYTNFYKKKKQSIFNSSTIEGDNKAAPTSNIIRFYPMFIKGKIQIPDSLSPAFVYATSSNYFANLIFEVMKNIEIAGKGFIDSVAEESYKFVRFTLDILFSTITFNASEFLKPYLGMTTNKARKGAYDKSKEANAEEYKDIMQFTPYDEKYHLMYDYDFTIGFFNARCMDVKDLYAGEEDKKESNSRTVELYNNKLSIMQKLTNNLFDFMCIVELYDSYNCQIEDGKNQNIFSFFDNLLLSYGQGGYITEINSNTIDGKERKEYAGLIANPKCFNLDYIKGHQNGNFTYNLITLPDNRKAVEIDFDISNIGIDEIKTLKVAFFHNYYGDLTNKMKDVYEERRRNLEYLLNKYNSIAESKEIAVAIIGDFNLSVYNSSDKNPHQSSASDINETFELNSKHKFKSKINKKTTLKSNGYDYNKPFDNVLVSINIADKVDAKAYVYPEENKLSISDHIPVYLGLKKIKG